MSFLIMLGTDNNEAISDIIVIPITFRGNPIDNILASLQGDITFLQEIPELMMIPFELRYNVTYINIYKFIHHSLKS